MQGLDSGCAMSEDVRHQASFATPTRGLVVRAAEGRRLGSLSAIPTTERRNRALETLTERGSVNTDLFGDEHSERRSIGGHESASGGTDEWLTPPDLIAALGPFDLDPCSPGDRRPWDTAAKHYGIEDDGLRQDWAGRVWLNPPYSTAARWMARLAEHGEGTALIFARTETDMWFQHVWPKASALLFLRRRLNFHYVNGKRAKANAGAPSVLVAYGNGDATRLADGSVDGAFVALGERAA